MDVKSHPQGGRSAVPSFLTIGLWIAGALLAGEAYARWFSKTPYRTPAAMKEANLEFDSEVLRRYVFPQKEKDVVGLGGARWHINALGYRGHDFSVEKPSDTVRIIIYGGSQVFDMQEVDWPHRVEEVLRNSGFPEVEVINAGHPGHMSYDSFEKLLTEGHEFNPDYVLLDDAWNDLGYFDSEKSFLRSGIHLKIIESGDPRVSYLGTLDRLLCGLSQAYGRLRNRVLIWRLNVAHEGMKRRRQPSSKISGIALKQYRLNVEMFVDCARDIGAVPILMTQPRLPDRRNTEDDKKRIGYEYQPFTPSVLCDALDRADAALFAVAKEKEVLLIDASSRMTGKGGFFMDHIHLSGDGSKKIAEIVADSLKGVLRRRRAGSL